MGGGQHSRRLRLAYFTPLNPQRSGISDYSEELLPRLGRLADIDLVIGPYEPSRPVARRFRVLAPREFLREAASYDCVLYQIGNNFEYHAYMIPCLCAVPGVVVLHDSRLHYLMMGLTLLQGNLPGLIEVLRPAYGQRSTRLAFRLLLSLADPYEIGLARPIIEMSRAVIVHNRYAAEEVVRDVPGKRVRVIGMGIEVRDGGTAPELLKLKHGFRADDFVIASVSSLALSKRLELILSALHGLKGAFPHLRFLIAGGGPLGGRTRRLIRRYRLERIVRHTGWLPADQYGELTRLADVVVDLRYPSAGETSASVLRAMEAGKPLVVSSHGFFRELPDACCFKIEVGAGEKEAFQRAIRTLIEREDLRRDMGSASRSYILANARLDVAARSYIEFLDEVIRSGEEPNGQWNGVFVRSKSQTGKVLSAVYKLFRLGYYCRRYGFADTIERIRKELPRSGTGA